MIQSIAGPRRTGRTLADALIRRLASVPALATANDRLRALQSLPSPKPGAYALRETIPAARPAIIAALHRSLGGVLLVVCATPDSAERTFADLLYYLGEEEPRTPALLRSRSRRDWVSTA